MYLKYFFDNDGCRMESKILLDYAMEILNFYDKIKKDHFLIIIKDKILKKYKFNNDYFLDIDLAIMVTLSLDLKKEDIDKIVK